MRLKAMKIKMAKPFMKEQKSKGISKNGIISEIMLKGLFKKYAVVWKRDMAPYLINTHKGEVTPDMS